MMTVTSVCACVSVCVLVCQCVCVCFDFTQVQKGRGDVLGPTGWKRSAVPYCASTFSRKFVGKEFPLGLEWVFLWGGHLIRKFDVPPPPLPRLHTPSLHPTLRHSPDVPFSFPSLCLYSFLSPHSLLTCLLRVCVCVCCVCCVCVCNEEVCGGGGVCMWEEVCGESTRVNHTLRTRFINW